eukprot:Skav227935  [mRNA]  locus=scaffold146:442335:443627:+ [translate_table: standard]
MARTPAAKTPKAKDLAPGKSSRRQSLVGTQKESKAKADANPKKRPLETPLAQATPQKAAHQTPEARGGETPPKTRKIGKGKPENQDMQKQQAEGKPAPSQPESMSIVNWSDWENLMLKLFDSIEQVLQLSAITCSVEMLQESIMNHHILNLTSESLQQILSLADGMLEAKWIGEFPYLSVTQQKEGKPARPEGVELVERRAKFQEALSAACKNRKVPTKPLPPRPGKGPKPMEIEEPVDVEAGRAAAEKLAELAKLPRLKTTGTCKQRMEALKARIAAKKAIVEKEENEKAEFQSLLDSINVCEDVLAAREVLTHLFARPGEGKIVNVSEKKILGALCSCSFADQCTRMVSLDAGKVALAKLKELGEGIWFSVMPAQYSEDNFWRRIPGGNDERVRAALNSQMRALQDRKRKLVSLGSVNIKAAKEKKDG